MRSTSDPGYVQTVGGKPYYANGAARSFYRLIAIRLAFGLALALAGSGCSSPPSPELSERDVPRFVSATGIGGATQVAPDVLVIARHQLREERELFISPEARIGYSILAAGDAVKDDTEGWSRFEPHWAVIRLAEPLGEVKHLIDPDFVPAPGAPVVLAGYPGSSEDIFAAIADHSDLHPQIAQRRAMFQFELNQLRTWRVLVPDEIAPPDSLVLCHYPEDLATPHGYSGGPAFGWCRQRKAWVIFGLTIAGQGFLDGNHVESGRVFVVRRLPGAVAEVLRERSFSSHGHGSAMPCAILD